MKTPEQWLMELPIEEDIGCKDVAAIQADARADLVESITEHILEMDKLMKGPASYQRGVAIAQSLSRLQDAMSEDGKFEL